MTPEYKMEELRLKQLMEELKLRQLIKELINIVKDSDTCTPEIQARMLARINYHYDREKTAEQALNLLITTLDLLTTEKE